MPFYHATWRRHLPSIQKYGLGGVAPDRQNFPVEAGVYLANEPVVALSILLEAYVDTGDELGLSPPEALADMCVLVIDDSRVNTALLDIDPNIERRDLTHLYRGIIDVTGLPVVSVDDIVPPDAMTVDEAKRELGFD
jgi:hypothetical protein